MTKSILKKGAMFGLDARICLFIFALVSVLTFSIFYNLYYSLSAEKILAETPAIKHGIEQYHDDMKASIFTSLKFGYNAEQIEDNSFATLAKTGYTRSPYSDRWDGPYIRIKNEDMTDVHLNAKYKLTKLSDSLSTTCNDVKTNKCYIFLTFKGLDLDACDSFNKSASKQYSKVQMVSRASDCDVYIKLLEDY
jgi:hypothetical protein